MPPPDASSPTELKVTHDIPKKQVQFKLQGLLLIGLEEMAKDRKETIPQVIKDILEQRLVKDGYLPEWYFSRRIP